MINDSSLIPEKAFEQNPDLVCPDEIMHSLGLLTVEYMSFDQHIHTGQMIIAQAVMADVDAFFRHALEYRFPIAKVVPAASYDWDDKKLMEANISSGFNYRVIAGTDQPSFHARGLAFDINPVQNPYLRYHNGKKSIQPHGSKWNKNQPGSLQADHPLVKLMEGFGWEWGGHWTPESGRTDYQHFQKTS